MIEKNLYIKDHKDPKTYVKNIIVLIINDRYKGYGRNVGRSDNVMYLVFSLKKSLTAKLLQENINGF